MSGNYRPVKRGTVEVGYTIYEYDMDDGTKVYDWNTDSGADEDELHDSIEEAESAVRSYLGG